MKKDKTMQRYIQKIGILTILKRIQKFGLKRIQKLIQQTIQKITTLYMKLLGLKFGPMVMITIQKFI